MKHILWIWLEGFCSICLFRNQLCHVRQQAASPHTVRSVRRVGLTFFEQIYHRFAHIRHIKFKELVTGLRYAGQQHNTSTVCLLRRWKTNAGDSAASEDVCYMSLMYKTITTLQVSSVWTDWLTDSLVLHQQRAAWSNLNRVSVSV